ncbi:DUF167 family protein [Rickettsia endosymbiont of Gonocerus acuteangulatus]|uniref:A1G_07140 family DUF167 domain protein n=1 Tax=Rickettsia endosymbiont of Gonocerus acuteangulatus TaxID=3066266 RepID=UPI003132DE0E
MKFFTYNSLSKLAFLNIKVKAAAKNNNIKEFIIINDIPYLKLSIKAHAQQGKANEEIINFLAKEWQLLRSNIEITNSLKTILIKNIDEEYLNLILKSYIK